MYEGTLSMSMTEGIASNISAMGASSLSKGSTMDDVASLNGSEMQDSASSNGSAMQEAASSNGSAMQEASNTQQSIGGGQRCKVLLVKRRTLRRKRRRKRRWIRAMVGGGRAASTGVAICMSTEAATMEEDGYTQQSIGGRWRCTKRHRRKVRQIKHLKRRWKLRHTRCRMIRRARAIWQCNEVPTQQSIRG